VADPAPTEAFSFVDENGTTVIADTLEAVPEQYRKIAKKVSADEAKKSIGTLEKQVEKAKARALSEAKEVQREAGDIWPFLRDVDLPSFGIGFAFALIFTLVFSIVKRAGALVFKLALLVAIVVLLSGSYFAWLRKAAGLGDSKLESPKALIEDAKRAAKAMEQRLEQQKRVLEKIEKNSSGR
jgi:hypothetical protein